jgi:hypothetical protein
MAFLCVSQQAFKGQGEFNTTSINSLEKGHVKNFLPKSW